MTGKSLPLELYSERLKLALVSVQWLDEILAENKGNVAEYFVKFQDREEAQTWINENRRLFERGEKLEMVLIGLQDEQFIGMASIHSIGIKPEISLWIRESAQRLGYGREAVGCLIEWFQKNFPGEKLSYSAELKNQASLKLAESLGMKRVGLQTNFEGKNFEEWEL